MTTRLPSSPLLMTEDGLASWARSLAEYAVSRKNTAQPLTCIALWGDLGVGKTTFSRFFLRSFLQDPYLFVPSPTFSFIQIYESVHGSVWHCDLYRLQTPDDAEELGLLEALNPTPSSPLCLIEWPEHLGHFLPKSRLDITFRMGKEDETREILLDNRT